MLKITITREFNSFEDAQAFLGAHLPQPLTVTVIPPTAAVDTGGHPVAKTAPPPVAPEAPPTKTRKPRADAGKPRGPYKTTGEPGKEAGDTVPATPSAPTTPTPSVAPVATAPESVTVAPAATAPAAADPTVDDMRAVLALLHKVPGKGTEACLAALQKFGVLRISDLPKGKYAEFVEHIHSQLPKGAA